MGDVDLDQLAVELAAQEQVPAIRREVHVVGARAGDGERMVQPHGLGVAEVEALQALGDDDGVAAVRCEVEVVRVGHRHGMSGLPGPWIDRRQAVALIVVHPERLQVVGGHHVLGVCADRELIDDPVGARVDHADGVALAVGNVDPAREVLHGRREPSRAIGCVDVVGVKKPGNLERAASRRGFLRSGLPGWPRPAGRAPREL